MSIKVAPDGAVLDRVAEFVFAQRGRIDMLFSNDEPGYTDAIFKFVQAIASSKMLLGSKKVPLTDETRRLKEHLLDIKWLEYSDFFANQNPEIRQATALRWLENKWPAIAEELSNPYSSAAQAILGHLTREFYYRWKLENPWWKEERYVAEGTTVHLPPIVLKRLSHTVQGLAENLNINITREELSPWIDANIVSHYRIFGEYLLNLDGEYLPALTRTSLECLETPQAKVENVIMPFVALKAVEKVTDRSDLVKRVAEWRDGEGRGVIEGIDRLLHVLRTMPTAEERMAELAEVGKMLRSNFHPWSQIVLDFLKIPRGEGDAVQTIRRVKSYRWIWKIRNPEMRIQWSRRLREILR